MSTKTRRILATLSAGTVLLGIGAAGALADSGTRRRHDDRAVKARHHKSAHHARGAHHAQGRDDRGAATSTTSPTTPSTTPARAAGDSARDAAEAAAAAAGVDDRRGRGGGGGRHAGADDGPAHT